MMMARLEAPVDAPITAADIETWARVERALAGRTLDMSAPRRGVVPIGARAAGPDAISERDLRTLRAMLEKADAA